MSPVQVLARYRRRGDTSADVVEVIVEADSYGQALTQARARTADGDDLISVQTIQA